MGTYHAKDVRSGKLPGFLDELLKPAPRALCLLHRGQFRRTRLVLGELGTDQVKYWGNSFLDLNTVRLPGVPFLDQLVQVLLSADFQHYVRVFKKNQARSQYKQEEKKTVWPKRAKRLLPANSRFLFFNSSPALRPVSSAPARSWSSRSLSSRRCPISSSRPREMIAGHQNRPHS